MVILGCCDGCSKRRWSRADREEIPRGLVADKSVRVVADEASMWERARRPKATKLQQNGELREVVEAD